MSAGTSQSRPKYRIASIPADGIGPEVIDAGETVLKKLTACMNKFDLEFEHFDWSSDYYKKHGQYLPEDALVTLKKFDSILFGSVGSPGSFALISGRYDK
jgi:isocitrate/isopropylmalate dehydrogenase